MAENTIISIPLHVRNDYLVQVIAKVVGEEWVHEGTRDAQKVIKNGRSYIMEVPIPFDVDQPTSKENTWSIKFSRRNKGLGIDMSASKDAGHGSLAFVDASGNPHSWYFHAENENEVDKLLRPGSHGFAVAVGRRVVKFFGGHLIETDFNDKVSLQVPNARAKFPKKLPTQSSDDRWYQFYNALQSEPVLSASELKSAMDQHGGNEGHQELLQYLQVQEKRDRLDEVLPQAAAGHSKPRM